MKYMNNHFGQSRIFGNARCKIPMNLQLFAESGDGGNGDGTESGADKGSGTGGEGDKPTYEQLVEELAKARTEASQANAERERFKNSVNDLTKKNGELTKQVRERMTADEQAEAAKAEAEAAKDARIQELESKFRMMDYSKRYMGVGMDEKSATELAELTGEIADVDKFFFAFDKFVKAVSKKASESAIETLIKNNPSVKAGNGDADKNATALEMARASAGRTSEANMDILKHYGAGGKR